MNDEAFRRAVEALALADLPAEALAEAVRALTGEPATTSPSSPRGSGPRGGMTSAERNRVRRARLAAERAADGSGRFADGSRTETDGLNPSADGSVDGSESSVAQPPRVRSLESSSSLPGSSADSEQKKDTQIPPNPPVGPDGQRTVSDASADGRTDGPTASKPVRGPRTKTSCPGRDAAPDLVASWLQERGLPSLTDAKHGPELGRFLGHHRAKGSTFKDWLQAWENWSSGRFVGGPSTPRVQGSSADRAAYQRTRASREDFDPADPIFANQDAPF